MFAATLALLGVAGTLHLGILFHQQHRRDLARLELERLGASVPYGETHLIQWIDRWLPEDLARIFYSQECEVHFRPEYGTLDDGIADAAMANLDDLTCATCVRLTGSPVTDSGIAHLGRSKALRVLYLDGTRVTDAGMRYLSGLSTLETLSLGRVPVSDAGTEHLKKLTRLKTLYLYGTQVTDTGAANLKEAIPGVEIHTDWEIHK
jgi:hypothetical protein